MQTRKRHDSSAAFALGFDEAQLLPNPLERLIHTQGSTFEIHIHPSEAEHLAEAPEATDTVNKGPRRSPCNASRNTLACSGEKTFSSGLAPLGLIAPRHDPSLRLPDRAGHSIRYSRSL